MYSCRHLMFHRNISPPEDTVWQHVVSSVGIRKHTEDSSRCLMSSVEVVFVQGSVLPFYDCHILFSVRSRWGQ
jgi:hypothetical protein